MGYWLAPWARRRGVMTLALRAVVEWATRVHGVDRLFLTTHPENVASQRVAERGGFTRVGLTEHQPPFRDGVTNAVLFELGGHLRTLAQARAVYLSAPVFSDQFVR